MGRKVALDPNKETWHPSVLPGQVILVSSCNGAGEPNIAPKSWVTMVAFAGPVIAFGCNTEHTTCKNIAARGEFAVNIPGEPLAETVWSLTNDHGEERLKRSGLTLSPAQAISVPIVEECPANLECKLDSIKEFGNEVLIFGKVVAASIDADCQAGTPPDQYFRLRPIFQLESGVYGSMDGAKYVGAERSTSHPLFFIQVGAQPGGRDVAVVKKHFAFLRGLRSQGRLLVAGPFGEGGSGGLYIVTASSQEDAEQVALTDPLVQAGVPYTVQPWTRTF